MNVSVVEMCNRQSYHPHLSVFRGHQTQHHHFIQWKIAQWCESTGSLVVVLQLITRVRGVNKHPWNNGRTYIITVDVDVVE